MDGDEGLSFERLIDTVLDARAKNPSTVKDMKQSTRLIKTEMHVAEDSVKDFIIKNFRMLTSALDKMKDDLTEDREGDADEDDDDVDDMQTIQQSTLGIAFSDK